MASKEYISIIDLFDHFDIAYDTEQNISRIKKQLTAEFDFSPDGMIVVNGHHYNKSDVLEELNHPDFFKRLAYHKTIGANIYLSVFIKDNLVNMPELMPQLQRLPADPDFEIFLSPYFARSFNIASRNYLQTLQFSELGDLLRTEDFIKSADREEAFRPVRIFLDENIRLLRNLNADNFKQMRPKLEAWLSTYWSRFLNHLPGDFYAEKNEIVLHLINLSVRIQSKHKKDSITISTELTCVSHVRDELSKLIINNHRAFTGKGSSDAGSRSYWWIFWLFVIIIKGAAHC